MGVLDDIKNSIGDHSSDKNKNSDFGSSENSFGNSSQSVDKPGSNSFDGLNNSSQDNNQGLNSKPSSKPNNKQNMPQGRQNRQNNSRARQDRNMNSQEFDNDGRGSQGQTRNGFQNQKPQNTGSRDLGNENPGDQNRSRAHRSGFSDSPNTQAGRPERGSSRPQVSENTRKKMENAGFRQGDKSDIDQLKSQNEQIIELLKRINQNLERI